MTNNKNSKVFRKFSPFMRIELTKKAFSWKIAILNTIGFCLIAFIDTSSSRYFFDEVAKNAKQKPTLSMQANNTVQEPNNTIQSTIIQKENNIPRCPMGYHVLLFAFLLVPGNYFLSRFKYWLPLILSPFLFTVAVCWFVSWINFTPPSPNLWQMWTFAIFPLFGLMATVIRYYEPYVQEERNLDEVNVQAQISWINETSQMWRTFGIGFIIPPLAFFAFWWPWISNLTTTTFTDPPRGHFHALWATVAAYIVVYTAMGPVYECLRKAEFIRNYLLDIKK